MSTVCRYSQDAKWEREECYLLPNKEEERGEVCLVRDMESLRSWTLSPLHHAFKRCLYVLILLLTNTVSIYFTYSYTKTYSRQAFSQDLKGSMSLPNLPSKLWFSSLTENLTAGKVFPGLDRSLHMVDFSNHRVNGTSRWTATPSKEVDHAWNELGIKDRGFLLPGKAGREYGLDPRIHVYAPRGTLLEEDDGFPVVIQGLHDLHCLNELRRALYFNKGYYRKFEDDTLTPEWFRVSHINHCLDNIREHLMCSADAGIIPSVWTSREGNRPLFGSRHKCHSYEALMEWNTEWHNTGREREVDWSVRVSAPDDAIFHDIHDFE